jgi:hypothetical protein
MHNTPVTRMHQVRQVYELHVALLGVPPGVCMVGEAG